MLGSRDESVETAPTRVLRGRGWSRGLVAGVLVTAVAYAAMAMPQTAGPCSFLLAGGLLVLVPTAGTLARRVAVNGAVLVGWLPVLWWTRWPVDLSRGAVVLAATAGFVAGAACASASPQLAARRLLPEARRVDLLIPAGGLLAAGVMLRWLFVRSPEAALTLLLPGADNYPHFHMFATIRTEGATIDALGRTADGSGWAFVEYPQGFHALAATISQLMHPGQETGPQLLVAYAHAVGVIVVLGVVLMSAALISVPGLRDRPAVAVPAVAVTCTAFLWEPGQHALADGFANFWLGAAAAGIAVVLAMSLPRFLSTPDLLALGGLFVACAHMWAPLVLFAAPAACAALVRDGTEPGTVPRNRVVAALMIGLCTAGAVLRAARILFGHVSVGYLVTTQTGGWHGMSPWPAFVLFAASVFCCLRYRPAADEPRPLVTRRVRLTALTPVGGFLVLAALLVAQLHFVGTTEYYFMKYFLGFVLVLALVAPAVCGAYVASRVPRMAPRRGLLMGVGATLLATQAFGWFPNGTMPLFSTTGQGTAGLGGSLQPAQVASGILAAARGTRPAATDRIEYFPLGRARALNPFYGDAWFHAIQHSLTRKVFTRYEPWRTGCSNLDCAASLVTTMLRQEADVRVVVDPRYLGPLRRRLSSPALARRVFSWAERDGGTGGGATRG